MSKFKKELEELINKHSKENESNTPDFILAKYLRSCLIHANYLIKERDEWWGIEIDDSMGIKIKNQ